MEINLGDERIVALQAAYSREEILEKALARRIDAFGQMAKLFQRPKPEDIEIAEVQHRFEPFWVASASAHYSYDRQFSYRVEVTPEVEAVTVLGQRHEVIRDRVGSFQLVATNHCVENYRRQVMVDAVRGTEEDLSGYLEHRKQEITALTELEAGGTMVVPPEVRSSFVVRTLVSRLVKTFQADRIHEERIDVDEMTLYYRPVYAVEFNWKPKNKRQVMEFDALKGEARSEGVEIKRHVKRILEADTLFDIGADTASMLIPGASIAIKLGRFAAKKAIR